MIIADRLWELRETKKLSHGDIEKRTGLMRCYISRVENGHTVPSIETLEKLARAREVPLYQLFYESEEPPKVPNLLKRRTSDDIAWGSDGKHAIYLHKVRKCLSRAQQSDRKLIMVMAQKMVWPYPLHRCRDSFRYLWDLLSDFGEASFADFFASSHLTCVPSLAMSILYRAAARAKFESFAKC